MEAVISATSRVVLALMKRELLLVHSSLRASGCVNPVRGLDLKRDTSLLRQRLFPIFLLFRLL